ncbi:hypothetical protein BDA96_10G132400 [Sorghum bicolor]|uniref:CCT domain-containing protein n=1 Tax=Sorghum bicolor TaxID=4558 RepID=A0A921Q1E9_SORBI|nr:hypothetical protein BDA96_10G132400 [Sorghum bicolor]
MIATTGSSAKTAAAAAVGGKSARACDGCLRRRARWYCAADDAFLCQGCDTSVHSANPLARRHERLRLQPAAASSPLHTPPRSTGAAANNKRERHDEVVPAWFRRKARTPRGGHAKSVGQALSRSRRPGVVVPHAAAGGGDSPDDGRSGEGELEAEEEQLLYRVPIFDPALAEFCSPPAPLDLASSCNGDGAVEDPAKPDPGPATPAPAPVVQFFPDSGHANFEPTDAELREFAADMEALLGHGLDDGNEEDSSFYMETLGLLDPVEVGDDATRVKVETDGGSACGEASGTLACALELLDPAEVSDEMLDIDFNYGSPLDTMMDDEKAASSDTGGADDAQFLQTSLSLTLNYEAIIQSWGSSPWTAGGERPHVKLDDSWPHTNMWVVGGVAGHGGEDLLLGTARLGMDGGREARVSRYREKRRTRLFSKKIRYEVRKLNAEKRPRMKGRFVKRATAGGSSLAIAGLA